MTTNHCQISFPNNLIKSEIYRNVVPYFWLIAQKLNLAYNVNAAERMNVNRVIALNKQNEKRRT